MHALRLLIAAFLVLVNHAVNAELITANFGGTVTLIIDNGSILHPSVQLPAPPPALSIEYVESWPVVILAWPISATGFYLEESSGFNNHPWTRVSQPPVIILSEYKVAVEPTNGAKFYRLRR